MKRWARIVAFIVGAVAMTVVDADACSCTTPDVSTTAKREQVVRELVEKSRAVFVGTIVEVTDFAVMFTVERVWKGNVPARLVMGTSRAPRGNNEIIENTCIVGFEGAVGRRFLVFADEGTPDRMKARQCRLTGEYERFRAVADTLDHLGTARVPQSEGDVTDYFAELRAAERTWVASRPRSYEFTIAVECFCYMSNRELTFRVVEGRSTLLDKVDERLAATSDSYGTIEGLFAVLRRTARFGPYKMNVTYDPTYGYPRKADLDTWLMVKDEELRFRITAFKSLGAGR